MSVSTVDPTPSVSAGLADARRLGDQELCDALLAAEVAIRRQQAEAAVLIAELVSRIEAMDHPISGAAEEVAALLAVSPRSADHRLDAAVGLCGRELVWAALFQGRIDVSKANLIVDLLAAVPDPRREQLELIALDFAPTHTGHQLRRKVLSLTCEKDPDDVLRRQAVDRRGVWIRAAGRGMADIGGYLSAEHAEIFLQALQRLADAVEVADPYQQGDERTAEQRRADALVGFLGMHTVVDVTGDVVISADALVGDSDWTPESKRLGPIASEVARDLCLSPDAR